MKLYRILSNYYKKIMISTVSGAGGHGVSGDHVGNDGAMGYGP